MPLAKLFPLKETFKLFQAHSLEKMIFAIPEKYQKPILLVFLLSEKLDVWTVENVKREFRKGTLRDPDILNTYHRLKNQFILENLSDASNCFVIKTESGVEKYGFGPKILFESKTRRIFDLEEDFYHLPKHVDKLIFRVDQLLTHAGISRPFVDYWVGQPLTLKNIRQLEASYPLVINVWMKQKSDSFSGYTYQQIYDGQLQTGKMVNLHFQSETQKLFLISDDTKYFSTLFICKNEEKGCYYRFNSAKKLAEHEKSCGNERCKIYQTEYGKTGKLTEKAVKNGLIPRATINRNFIFYDIESTLPKSAVATNNTRVLSTHHVVSIAVNR